MPEQAPAQTGKLTITFTDGSQKEIGIKSAIELKLTGEARQSLYFGQTKNGEWVMTYDARLMDGKKLQSMELTKVNQ